MKFKVGHKKGECKECIIHPKSAFIKVSLAQRGCALSNKKKLGSQKVLHTLTCLWRPCLQGPPMRATSQALK